jgi:hypothetical protein
LISLSLSFVQVSTKLIIWNFEMVLFKETSMLIQTLSKILFLMMILVDQIQKMTIIFLIKTCQGITWTPNASIIMEDIY